MLFVSALNVSSFAVPTKPVPLSIPVVSVKVEPGLATYGTAASTSALAVTNDAAVLSTLADNAWNAASVVCAARLAAA